jgi:hypothetical protein
MMTRQKFDAKKNEIWQKNGDIISTNGTARFGDW